jgi:hypothetical protein
LSVPSRLAHPLLFIGTVVHVFILRLLCLLHLFIIIFIIHFFIAHFFIAHTIPAIVLGDPVMRQEWV